MFTAYVGVTLLAAAANSYAATADLLRLRWIFDSMTRMGVPHSWMVPLGALKGAGALGLLLGIGVPLIGIAAAVGLILFFAGAVITHMRAHADASTYPYPAAFLLLALGSLLLRLASS
jgi:hypothetical protein